MATNKPLPDTDDDIIDLTDLVEEGSADEASSGDGGPVDMSFEQELEDLFGDADPAPAKTAAKAPASPAPVPEDEDLIDLTGFGVDDLVETTAAPAGKAQDEDDVVDLAGMGFDDLEAASPPAAAGPETPAVDDALADLFGEAETPAKAAPRAAPTPEAEDVMAGLGFDAPEEPPVATVQGAKAFDHDAMDLLGFEEASPETEPAAASPADDAMDLSDMDLAEFEPAPQAVPAAPEAAASADDETMADLLGELPEAPVAPDDDALDIADLSGLPSLEEMPASGKTPAAEPEPAAVGEMAMAGMAVMAAGAVAGAAAMTAGAARTTPPNASTGTAGAIDLGALDQLIDTAKGPLPEPEPEEAPSSGKLDALVARISALETATSTLFDKIETLPPATDGEALADALSARLEDALSERLEAVLAGQPQMPDVTGLKAQILAEIEARAPDHAALLAELQSGLALQFAALREDLPIIGELAGKTETAAALEGLRESLARLEALTQGRQTKFEDFAETMETRLAELRRELPQPEEFASTASVTDALETLRENLSRDIAANLDERLAELRRELRETLAGDIAANLDERLDGVTAAARQAAAEEVRILGEALSCRLEALETDRIDPDALAERMREALASSLPDLPALKDAGATAALAEETANDALARIETKLDRQDLDTALETLRTEMTAEMERAVPRAAAAVIREELANLAKELE